MKTTMRFLSVSLKILATLELVGLVAGGPATCLLSAGTLFLGGYLLEEMAGVDDEDKELETV